MSPQIEEIAQGAYGDITHIRIYQDGEEILRADYARDTSGFEDAASETSVAQYDYTDQSWHPYLEGTDLHTVQSATKSILALGIGIAVDEGLISRLDAPAMAYLAPSAPEGLSPEWSRITIEDLLTMRSGIDWAGENQTGYVGGHPTIAMENSEDWLVFIFSRPIVEAPGARFDYNDGASVLLGEILRNATGQPADQYIARKLFDPLDIENFYWKRAPDGVVDTEGGLYLTPDSFAKIGRLVANGGRWKNTHLVSRGWIDRMSKPHALNARPDASLDYGYQWWLLQTGEETGPIVSARGFGGQYLLVDRKENIVIAVMSWDNETKRIWNVATDIMGELQRNVSP